MTLPSEHRHEVTAGWATLLGAGSFLSVGIAAGGILTLALNLLLARYFGTREYSTLAPLLSFGALAGVASAGVQNAIMFDIVSHGTFSVVKRHLGHLVVVSAVLMALSPLVAVALKVSLTSAIVAMVFASATLLSCVPVAMLLANRRVTAIAGWNFLQALIRLLAVVPFRHGNPVTVAFAASFGAVAVGVPGMLTSALRNESSPRRASGDTPVQIIQYALGAILFLPVSVPTWFARRVLNPSDAGVVALAVVVASTIAMFAGPVTSVVTPRIRSGERHTIISRGAWLTGLFAGTAGVVLVVAAPVILPHVESTSLVNFASYLVPLAGGAVVWSLALYFTWVDVAARGRAGYYLLGCLGALVIQAAAAWAVSSAPSITWGPLLSGVVYGIAVFVEFRRHWRGDVSPAA